jgi:hypothetical protein
MSYNPALIDHPIKGRFPYVALPARVSELKTLEYRDGIRGQFIRLAKQWDRKLNTEWILRHYLAAKLMLASSLMLASEDHARRYALDVARPYLTYYGLFQAARAVILTLPSQDWRDGALITISHVKVGNVIIDTLARLDSSLLEAIGHRFVDARSYRELFSYAFPAAGLESIQDPAPFTSDEAVAIATLFCEIAQLNSEALDISLAKHSPHPVGFAIELSVLIAVHATVDGREILDSEDAYRIHQLIRRIPRPVNLWDPTREGMIEDFYSSWGGGDQTDPAMFNADTAWHLIYPFS